MGSAAARLPSCSPRRSRRPADVIARSGARKAQPGLAARTTSSGRAVVGAAVRAVTALGMFNNSTGGASPSHHLSTAPGMRQLGVSYTMLVLCALLMFASAGFSVLAVAVGALVVAFPLFTVTVAFGAIAWSEVSLPKHLAGAAS